MKILFIAPQPFFSVRGTPINIRNFCRALGELGHKIDLLTYHLGEDVYINGTRLKRIPHISFIKNVSIGFSGKKLFLDMLLLIESVKLFMRNRYDVVHAVEEAAFIGILLKRIFRVPLIYDMDSDMAHQLEYTGKIRSKKLLKIIQAIEGLLFREADIVVPVCTELTIRAREKQCRSIICQIEDIPLVDSPLDFTREELLELRIELGLSPEDKVVLYTGNFEPYQGIDLLLSAWQYINSRINNIAKLVIVGGEIEQVAHLRSKIKEMNIDSSVLLTGKVPVENVGKYIALSYILVSPRLEGTNTPMKIYTYLKSGHPIIATDLPTHTQVLTPDISCLVPPRPEPFGDAIISLLKDPEMAEELGKRGYKFVSENYSWERFKEKIKDVYDRIYYNVL